MNFRRSHIIFPWCKGRGQQTLFLKVYMDDSQMTETYLRQNLPFSATRKKSIRPKSFAAILSNKKYNNLPFSARTKRVFPHFFMATM